MARNKKSRQQSRQTQGNESGQNAQQGRGGSQRGGFGSMPPEDQRDISRAGGETSRGGQRGSSSEDAGRRGSTRRGRS